MNFTIKFSSTPILLICSLLLAILFTLFIYRSTTPAVANWVRRSLAFLRSFALAAALMLLFEPIISLAFQRLQKPAVAVLIDSSASMTLGDSTKTRAAMVRKILSGESLHALKKKADVFYYSFSDRLSPLSQDSISYLRFNGDGSNIAAALDGAKAYLADRQYSGAILLSDGAYNIGINPVRIAEKYGVLMITTRFGSTRQAQDVMINDVTTNEIAYAETKLPIEINISAQGFQGRKATIHIFEDEKEIVTQDIELPADLTQVSTKITIIPQKIGLNRYVVKIDEQESELTYKNNRRAFYVKVLKGKINLWLFAGAPSADFSFLKRSLASDPNFSVTGFTQRPGGGFYSQNDLKLQNKNNWNKVDGVIFIDFPRRDTNGKLLQILETQLIENGKPLFYLHGPQVDLQTLWQLRKALPLAQIPRLSKEQSIELKFKPAGLAHPVIRLLSSLSSDGSAITSLLNATDEYPPLYSNIVNVKALPGSDVLAGASTESSQRKSKTAPLWISHKTAARKTMVILTYGLWRWNMLMRAVEKSSEPYDNIIRGIVRWMVTKEDAKLVRIVSNKEIYRGGEQIKMTAQVYHDDYRPLENAHVKVQVTGPQFHQDIILQEIGSGLYRTRLQVLGDGEYVFNGIADIDGQKIGEDTGKFSVEPFSQEFLNTNVNEPLLRQMAELYPDGIADRLPAL